LQLGQRRFQRRVRRCLPCNRRSRSEHLYVILRRGCVQVRAKLSHRLHAAATADEQARHLVAECENFIAGFDEEPDGAGFYVLGALVSLYYASCSLSGVRNAPLNSVKRFLDLVGAADDAGESGLYDRALQYLTAPSSVERDALARRVSAHAASMQ